MLRMKRTIILSFCLVFLAVNLFSVSAEEISKPSDWAENDIVSASQAGLIPTGIEGGYQDNIKRYEYVLIALEVLKAAGVDIDITRTYPFKDISGHASEYAIVQAYNIGIINGYEDGTFRPDNEITRQEIATLIVNLVKILEPDESTKESTEFKYSDATFISPWARNNVDYCFGKGIIKGIGKDSQGLCIISPLGQATVEQSEVMLYRLAANKGLTDSNGYGEVIVVEGFEVTDPSDISYSYDYDDFAAKVGNEIADLLYYGVDQENLRFTFVSDKRVVIEDKDNRQLLCYVEEDTIKMDLESFSTDSGKILDLYIDLLSQSVGFDTALNAVYDGIRLMKDMVEGDQEVYTYEDCTIQVSFKVRNPDLPEEDRVPTYLMRYEFAQ